MNRKFYFFLLLAAVNVGQSEAAFAQVCKLQETATVSLSLNGLAETPEKIMDLIESKARDITAMATAKGATKFDLQSKNYSINSASNSGMASGYNYNANYSFVVEPASLAVTLMQESAKSGVVVSMNVNSYRQCQ